MKLPHSLGLYKLEGHTPVPIEDPSEWAENRGSENWHVALDKVNDSTVSTVFLGIDHSWGLYGEKQLFETAIFSPTESVNIVERYATWEEAETGHREVVQYLLTLQ